MDVTASNIHNVLVTLDVKDEDVVTPRWGQLGLDQFMITLWNKASSERPEAQRVRLAREYSSLGCQARSEYTSRARDPDTVPPSTQEVEAILHPFRNVRQRLAASRCESDHGGIWLRTCYDISLAEKHKEILNLAEPYETWNEDVIHILDDEFDYNFEDDWARIFDILPELSECSAGPPSEHYVEEQKTALAKNNFDEDIRRLRQLWGTYAAGFSDEQMREEVIEGKCRTINLYSISKFLIVEDREAMETLKPKLIYFDQYGGIIKHARVEADSLQYFPSNYANAFISDHHDVWTGDHFEYGPGHSVRDILDSLKTTSCQSDAEQEQSGASTDATQAG